MATVASTLFQFTEQYPFANIIAIGSTLARTRLYRIGITTNLEMIQKYFEIYGLKENNWVNFKKGVEYKAFLVRRKK